MTQNLNSLKIILKFFGNQSPLSSSFNSPTNSPDYVEIVYLRFILMTDNMRRLKFSAFKVNDLYLKAKKCKNKKQDNLFKAVKINKNIFSSLV